MYSPLGLVKTFVIITIYATLTCRRPIRMSLLCQIEMTLLKIFREVSGVTVRLMSDKELARLEVLRDLDQQRLTPAAAARLLGLERRQVFRLLKVYGVTTRSVQNRTLSRIPFEIRGFQKRSFVNR